jgi:hypothetical protein
MADTLADRLNALAAQYRGAWTRTPYADGSVVVRMILASGDVIAGTGETTAAAAEHLERRLAAFTAAAEA